MQLEWVSPQTGVDDEGGVNSYKKDVHIERNVSLTKTFDLEGCLAVKISLKMKHQCTNVK